MRQEEASLQKRQMLVRFAVLLIGATTLLAGCSHGPVAQVPNNQQNTTPAKQGQGAGDQNAAGQAAPAKSKVVDKDPNSVTVLINKEYALPKDYVPQDLVDDPNIPFIFKEKSERRMLRKVAADALEKMFAAAKQDGIELAGVSAYRSYGTQQSLFNTYVQQQGEKEARRYSAVPGYSEHETGLAIDVSGSTGQCAADNCFAGTPEAKWLAAHVQDYGYIIRYPQGKEDITGYAYEPWHIRYVGVDVAKEIMSKGITLEEYEGAKPASQLPQP